mmetsp:Transcript_23722/g.64531  ORF Transcript_23722/g.64531 Transcript_23722/m.64531 type:complete len:633 (-) Transcript_23722:92-1990(-)
MLPRWMVASWALPALGSSLPAERPHGSAESCDSAAFIQGLVELHKDHALASSSGMSGERSPLAVMRREPWEGGTIGDIAPRILTDDAIEALRKNAERLNEEEDVPVEQGLSESTAETLAAALGVGLNRITARLDIYLTRVMHVKEKLLHAVSSAAEGEERLKAFEAAMNETLDVAQQGSTTVAVVLRSTVSSSEANLESAGQRDLAAVMEDSLGSALSQFEGMSQPAFFQAKDHVVGLYQDAGSAAHRLAGLREALRSHRRQANALGHQLYKQFQELVVGIGGLAEAAGLPSVAVYRVKTAFHVVQESAAAVAWKLYLPAWELATGAGAAAADLGVKVDEPAAESADEPFGGEIAAIETSPLKPAGAAPVTRDLDTVEAQVDALLEKTLMANEKLHAAVPNLGRGGEQSFEEAVMEALKTVEPDWRAVGDALKRTAKSITHCLETAGQHDTSMQLDSLFGDALVRDHMLSHVLDDPLKLSASLEEFLQQQDVLAQSFFRTYHEFMNGVSHAPTAGLGVHTISLQRFRLAHPQRLDASGSQTTQGRNLDSLCAALGGQSGGHVSHNARLDDMRVMRLDATLDEETETARRMLKRAQEVAFGSVQQAAAIAWKMHSAAWVLVSGIRKATVALIG